MSRFFIGQRVRVVNAHPTMARFIGLETRIVARAASEYPRSEWVLDLIERGRQVGARSEHLEPILPEGAAPSEHTFHQLMDRLTAGEVECV